MRNHLIPMLMLFMALGASGCGEDEPDPRDGVVETDATDAELDATSCTGVDIGSACSTDGQRCEIGEECCCGECSPSLVCTCSGGTWACYYTDFCMRPACPDADDAHDTEDAPDGDGAGR